MRVTKKKRKIILKGLSNGSIKRLGRAPDTYSVPVSFFVLGITATMISQVDKEK